MVLHPASLEIIMTLKGKFWAKFNIYGCPRSFHGPLRLKEKVSITRFSLLNHEIYFLEGFKSRQVSTKTIGAQLIPFSLYSY